MATTETSKNEEEVFSSAVTKAPIVEQALVSDDEAVLDSTSGLTPQAAFEVFQGKLYRASNSSGKAAVEEESPLDQLARLQAEVAALEERLQQQAGQGSAFDEQLVSLAGQLQGRLSTLQPVPQDHLTRLIREQKESLGTTATSSKPVSKPDETGLVYELYPSSTTGPPTSSLEERLIKLESLVGAATTSSSLLARLDHLESLTPTSIEDRLTKAKVLRSDLEAASKARHKVLQQKGQDAKQLADLHAQLIALDGLSNYLPMLVERLQSLSQLHVQSSQWEARLASLEGTVQQLEALGLPQQMQALSKSLVENMQTLEQNLAKLDGK